MKKQVSTEVARTDSSHDVTLNGVWINGTKVEWTIAFPRG